MNTLPKVQKIFRVIGILTKIAFVFSIVGASICAMGALCSLAWYTGGQVFTLFGEPITFFSGQADVNQVMAVLLTDLVFLITEAILLFFAQGYIKTEQAGGTPFTEKGADMLKKLGIRCIWMPIVAMVIVSIILLSLNVERDGDISNLPSIATGVILILTSVIFRYGGELEQRAGQKNIETEL